MKKILTITICMIFVNLGNVYAQPLKKHTFEIGPEISYRTYKEPDFMEEKGMMYGLVGSYTYHNKLMLKVEGRGSWGKVDYSNSGKIEDVEDYLLEARALIGYDFPIMKVHAVTPYIGIGYRYLNDDSSGKISTTGALGYERESNYLYSPIGIEVMVNLGDGLSIGESIEFDYFWGGKQKSHLSDAIPGLNDVGNKQKEGYGLRGSIGLLIKTEKMYFDIGPSVRYWNIKKSEIETLTNYGTPIGYAWEPKNNTLEIGFKVSIKF